MPGNRDGTADDVYVRIYDNTCKAIKLLSRLGLLWRRASDYMNAMTGDFIIFGIVCAALAVLAIIVVVMPLVR